ncbi:holocytochrome c-type synthase-like [Rhopilema esculentum]|uniref:holocytochrome c-type synthase-like n=1 Tax=Rhopilema esculentum TaxID=499914 RepID=UPI0031DD9AE5|eukprot:gene4674-20958_t
MGSSTSVQATAAGNKPQLEEASVEKRNATDFPPSGCPMHQKHEEAENTRVSAENTCPIDHNKRAENDNAHRSFSISDCPVHAGKTEGKDGKENGDINLANMMPPPNQQPSPGQPFLLPTNRQKSTIPRGGTDNTWEYPSQQMFWNAMLRKGWRWEQDDLKPDDMAHIIRIHNANNELAWQEILKWEAFHSHECDQPKLLKFGGKAKEFSPRARIRSWLGYDLPFDRHDWIIDRCGKQVRYIIDYYDVGDNEGYQKGEFVHMDVRPAFDSFGAVLDRSRVAMLRWAAMLSTLGSSKDNKETIDSSEGKTPTS